MAQLSLDWLANMIGTLETESTDGCTNVERVDFVRRAFSVEHIDLNAVVDYELALVSDDPTFVQAAIHLAKLQIQYIAAAAMSQHIAEDAYRMKVAIFAITIEKMGWHLKHLNMDKKTPPYPFIH